MEKDTRSSVRLVWVGSSPTTHMAPRRWVRSCPFGHKTVAICGASPTFGMDIAGLITAMRRVATGLFNTLSGKPERSRKLAEQLTKAGLS